MKRIIWMLLLALLLTACARQEPPEPVHFTAKVQDATITLDAPAEEILEQLGSPLGYSESASCAFAGIEKSYVYRSVCIQTYPASDGDRISGFWFTDGSGTTAEGIAIGDDAERVRLTYGTFTGDGCVLTLGQEKLTILLEDGKVASIVYSMY